METRNPLRRLALVAFASLLFALAIGRPAFATPDGGSLDDDFVQRFLDAKKGAAAPGYQHPVATTTEEVGRAARGAKDTVVDTVTDGVNAAREPVEHAAWKTGRTIATAILRLLVFMAPPLIIFLVAGFIFGSFEVVFEGGSMVLWGGLLLWYCKWPGQLGEAWLVWLALVIPGIILFIVGWFVPDGKWKLVVALLPLAVMLLITVLDILDILMQPLIHGNAWLFGALVCLAFFWVVGRIWGKA